MTTRLQTIRIAEELSAIAWPAHTSVTREGGAVVVRSLIDLTTDDLEMVQRQYPDRRVTLDGDCVVVWPRR